MATDSYWSGNAYTSSNAAVQFARLGHPGRYTSVQTVNNTTVNFTGSNYGYGALMVGEDGATGTLTLTGGGSINIAHLPHEVLFEFSVATVSVNDKEVYVFKRQQ